MQFFFKYEMSRIKGIAKTMQNTAELTLDIDLGMLINKHLDNEATDYVIAEWNNLE